MEPDAVEMRVLGCLIEKQRTTPDTYPLTLNSLRLACNQSTNRDPVVDYDEREIRAALERLGRRRWTRLASWGNSRVMKYRHLLDETLELSGPELSLLAVLMLRGAQTPGELRQRGERLHRFEEDELQRTLDGLAARELVRRLPRRPGERGQRWVQLLGDAGADAPGPAADDSSDGESPADRPPPIAAGSEGAPAPAGAAAVEGASVRPRAAGAQDASEPPIAAAVESASAVQGAPAPAGGGDELTRRVARLEQGIGPLRAEVDGRLEHLERELEALRRELRDLREQLGG